MLHNLLHSLPDKVTEIECLSILCVGDASPQECGSLPLAVCFNFPSGRLLHSHSREAVAWGIWKTPAGNERNFCFSFFLNHPLTPCSLYFGRLCTAGALEFSLVSECSPTITTSHKQWGLLIGGLRKRVAVAGLCSRFRWQRASRMVLKGWKYRLYQGLWKI